MIQMRHRQPTLWAGYWREEVSELWEPWMRQADHLLDDETLVELIYDAQARRRALSRKRGRKQTPAEVVLRLLMLKHVRNWSFETLEREVRANLIYRDFTRIGTEKVPDAKVIGKIARVVGPEVIKQMHQRLVALAVEQKLVRGRKMRVDTTVVETNIHYPTDSTLLGDGTRVLTRLSKRIAEGLGKVARHVRDRMKSVNKKVMAIAIGARQQGAAGEEKRKKLYGQLLTLTRRVINQTKRTIADVSAASRRARAAAKPLVAEAETMIERVKQVIKQTKGRVFAGNTQMPDKLVSVFQPHTEIIRKGKASKPTEFGKLVKIQEAEGQVIIDYEVYPERPSDSDLLVDAVATHEKLMDKVPHLVAADAGFFSGANEKKLTERGVKRVSIPSKKTKSAARRQTQKERWFKDAQRWRTGCEGRISVLKRRHGLNRSLYPGQDGMERWVGLGVMADNLINLGGLLAERQA
jgi:IS5 family transposase